MNPFRAIWLNNLEKLMKGESLIGITNNESQLQPVPPEFKQDLFKLEPVDPTDAKNKIIDLYNKKYGKDYGLGCVGGDFTDNLLDDYIKYLGGQPQYIAPVETQKSSNKNYLGWIIAVIIILIFAITSPKTLDAYDKSERERKYYKVENYLLFSTLNASYQSGEVWKVVEVGVLGMTFKVREY